MTVEDITKEIYPSTGRLGRYQIVLFTVAPLCLLLTGVGFFANSLLAERFENITCQIDINVKNAVEKACKETWTYHQDTLTIPLNNKTKEPDHCYKYELDPVLQPVDCSYWFSNLSSKVTFGYYTNTNTSVSLNTTKCTSWNYYNDVFRSTVASEFNLVCENAWKSDVASLGLMFGVLIGSILFGITNDRFGRKPTFVAGTLTLAVSEILSTFVRNFAIYCVLQVCTGAGFIGVCSAGYIAGMEVLNSRHRVIAAQYIQSTFSVSTMLLAFVGFLVPDWRKVGLMSSIPLIFGTFLFWRIALESPRWLYAKNRTTEANNVVRKIAKINGKNQELELVPPFQNESDGEFDKMVEISLEAKIERDDSKISFFVLFTNCTLLKITTILSYNWFAVSCIYYGLSFSATQLAGNVFLNLFFNGLVEIPANCCTGLLMNFWGRRPVICVFHLLSGTALLCMMFVPADMTWISLTLFLLGKFGTTGAFGGVYLYTSELYPTPIRGNGMGCCGGFSRLGGMSAIVIIMLGSVSTTLPYIVFGAVGLLAGILVGLLPETKHNGFPDTIEECEEMDKKRTISLMSQFFPCLRR